MHTTDQQITTPGIVRERVGIVDVLHRRAGTRGGRALLIGAAGMGKTHIVDHLLRAVHPERLVLVTRPTEFDQQPFAGLADLTNGIPYDLVSQLDPQQQRALGAVLDGTAPEAVTPLVLQAAVNRLLLSAAKLGLTIVVDDWQWLDPESRRVLERSLQQPAVGDRAAVIAARRPDGPAGDSAERPLFTAEDVVALPPLSAESLRAVLLGAGSSQLPQQTIAEVVRASAGNPLWAIELATAHGLGDARPTGASSVQAAMSNRLGALSPTARAALAAAAVLGKAPLADLVAVCGDAETAVQEAIEAGVLRLEETTVVPAHPLLAAASVQSLGPEEERRVHAAVAVLPMSPARRAEHHDRSVPAGQDEQIATRLSSFATQARRAGATETALRLTRRAVARSVGGSPSESRRTVEAAELAFAIGDWRLVLELAGAIDPSALPVDLFDRLVHVTMLAIQREGGETSVRRYLTDLAHSVDGQAVHSRIVEVRMLTRDRTGAGFAQQLEDLARSLPAEHAARAVSAALYWVAFLRVDTGRGIDEAVLDEMRIVNAHADFVPLEDTADAVEALLAHDADDLSRSRAKLTGFVRSAQLSGEVYPAVQGLAHASIVETLAGRLSHGAERLEDAERQAQHALAIPPSLYRARALAALGRDDRAAVDEVVQGMFTPSAEFRGSLLQIGVTGLDAAYDGRWTEAAAVLRDALCRARATGIEDPGRRLWVDIELARALVHTGDHDGALAIATHLAEVGRRPGRVHARGQSLRVESLVALATGRPEDALALSSRAIADLHRGGLKPEYVRARIERLAVLEAIERIDDAVTLVADVETDAVTLGDPRVLAAVAGWTERLLQRDKRSRLTGAEGRVAVAAAAGRTNREIAEDLFISVRTVESHLSSAYRKLGVQTRTQLALSLTRS
jgi:DNA-binding CsgD family transcriptional regulator